MDAPKYEAPKPSLDPDFLRLQDESKRQEIDALQLRAQSDTAALMARYGTRLALAAASGPAGQPPASGTSAFSVPELRSPLLGFGMR